MIPVRTMELLKSEKQGTGYLQQLTGNCADFELWTEWPSLRISGKSRAEFVQKTTDVVYRRDALSQLYSNTRHGLRKILVFADLLPYIRKLRLPDLSSAYLGT